MFPMFAFIPWLVGALASLVTYFTAYFTKKWAVRLGVMTAILALTASFTYALGALVLGLSYVYQDSYFLYGISLLPGNTIPCVSAYLSSGILRVVYNQKYDFFSRWIDGGL